MFFLESHAYAQTLFCACSLLNDEAIGAHLWPLPTLFGLDLILASVGPYMRIQSDSIGKNTYQSINYSSKENGKRPPLAAVLL